VAAGAGLKIWVAKLGEEEEEEEAFEEEA